MASSSIQCGGGCGGALRFKNSNPSSTSSCLNSRSPSLVSMTKTSRSGCFSAAKVSVSASAVKELSRRKGGGASSSTKIDHETMDRWMPDAVVEIVKNLKQAPLLMQVYDTGDLKTEKAVAEKWPEVKESWSGEEAPEGVILVEEIAEEEDEVTKAWGIVIQGRGCEYGPACYLLKTSRVRSGVGSAACTHFCLTKVSSFRETAFSQLANSWLLR